MEIYLIYQTQSMKQCDGNKRSLVAVCSNKKKAISMIKELVSEPDCERPVLSECTYDEELEYGHIENEYGYCCDYDIEIAYMNEYIE